MIPFLDWQMDYSTAERAAWQRGDTDLASVLAAAVDAEKLAEELEAGKYERESDAEKRYSRAQEAWSDHNTKMRARLENLRQLVEQAARVSGRELILRRIDEAENLIDEAEWR